MPKVAGLNALYPTECPVLLRVREEHADWNWLYEHDYIRYNKCGVKVYEHKLVATLAHGDIPKGHHVHHKNENRTENSAFNLEILTNSTHQKIHHGTREFVELVCPVCNNPFMRDKTQVKYEIHYCGTACAHIAQRPVEPPTREQLIDLITSINSWREIGRLYGVVDNTVKGWAQSYGIDLKCSGSKAHTYKAMFHKTSRYKGVSKRKDRSRWYAKIIVDEQEIRLGTFETQEDAAKAYDAAALKYFGPNVYLNFPVAV